MVGPNTGYSLRKEQSGPNHSAAWVSLLPRPTRHVDSHTHATIFSESHACEL